MKTEKKEKESFGKRILKQLRSMRAVMVIAFVAFAVTLMAILWIIQVGSLGIFYKTLMMGRAEEAVEKVSSYYSDAETLDAAVFYKMLADFSDESDIYFYVESMDGSFAVSSTQLSGFGRGYFGMDSLLEDARALLNDSRESTVSFMQSYGKDASLLVCAAELNSDYRDSVRIYAVAPLTPLGATVGILRRQLMFITAISLLLGAFIAFVLSKYFSRPIKEVNEKAKSLADGNYNIEFDLKGYTELEELSDTLNETAIDLAKTESLQKDIIANVSHDLRTPLTMIKSYAEMIRDISGGDEEKRTEHLEVIISESDRLETLVEDLLMLSKMQSGTMEMENSRFDIQTAARDVLAIYKVLEDSEGFVFNFLPVEGAMPIVYGDERKIQRVFANFISNAVKYTGDLNKQVDIIFRRDADVLVCGVRDYGLGISEEDQQAIWDRYQMASSKGARSKSGTGLGLSIAKEILEKHGCEYGVDSAPGLGSCFWFKIKCDFAIDAEDSL